MADSDATLEREHTRERVDGGSKSRPMSESTAAMQNTEIDDEEVEPEKFKAGFFDKDPYTTQQRKIYLKIMAMGSFLTIMVVFCVLSIYWGSLWQATSKISKMHGWIVVRSFHCYYCYLYAACLFIFVRTLMEVLWARSFGRRF